MTKRFMAVFILVGGVTLAAVMAFVFLRHHTVAVLSPQGHIASQERRLMLIAGVLALLVVIPVFGMLFWFSWKYRAGNTKAVYRPDWSNSRIAETIWWGVPTLLIAILSVITWQSSHNLDPYKALDPSVSSQKPMVIQVVALPWRWLFIYPDQQVASLNYVTFPENRPVTFQITADAPMNSFWIPQLGGQMYAMTGMSTELHVIADHPGQYRGSSANISGSGFADMHFIAQSRTNQDYNNWMVSAQKSAQHLTTTEYAQLAQPSHDQAQTIYSNVAPNLYNGIVMEYNGSYADGNGYGHG